MEEGKKRNGKQKESNSVLGQPLAHAQSGVDTREPNEHCREVLDWLGGMRAVQAEQQSGLAE